MNAPEFERRLRALAKREGLTFATLATLPPVDRATVLTSIVHRFDPDAIYRERDVNALLKAWLAGAGIMFETDHVHVRRWLVDLQVLCRTSDCAEYRLDPRVPEREDVVHDPDVARLDPDRIVSAVRLDARTVREQRKSAWLERARGAAGDRE